MDTSMEPQVDASLPDTHHPFLRYLSTWQLRDEEMLVRAFESRPCVIAVWRMLAPLEQKCYLQIMYGPRGNGQRDWRARTKKRHEADVNQALAVLIKLRIVETDEGENEMSARLNEDFRMNFLSSLLSTPIQLAGLEPMPDLDEKLTKKAADKDLFRKSIERWEAILSYLALPSDSASKDVSKTTRELFQHIGFTREGGKELAISSAGFQFLLLNRVEQIWKYMVHYLKFLESTAKSEGGEDVVMLIVEFLLKLMLCVPPGGEDSSSSSSKPIAFKIDAEWPKEVVGFLQHLRKLGLVFMRKKEDGFFFLTPLLTQLAISEGGGSTTQGASTSSSSTAGSKGFLVTETNFRIYAYTTSRLHLAILTGFTELLYHFQDVVVGIMTRESVRRALQTGITAQQIILYLQSNAHPQTIATHGQANCVPVTVTDQILLWEQERRRLSCSPATLYSTFESEAEFLNLRNFAAEHEVLLWFSDQQKLVAVCDPEGTAMVKEWWKSQRKPKR